jgi:hypothetical protein
MKTVINQWVAADFHGLGFPPHQSPHINQQFSPVLPGFVVSGSLRYKVEYQGGRKPFPEPMGCCSRFFRAVVVLVAAVVKQNARQDNPTL